MHELGKESLLFVRGEAPDVEHRFFGRDQLQDYREAFAEPFHPVLVNVLMQDGVNMPTMQGGTGSDA